MNLSPLEWEGVHLLTKFAVAAAVIWAAIFLWKPHGRTQ